MKVEPIQDKETIRECMEYLKYKNERNLVMFSIGINAGLRISDILPLKVKDVKNVTHIKIIEKKTGKAKRFKINPYLRKEIDKYIENMSDDDYLFPSRKGNKPITRVQAYRILNDVAEKLGIEEVGTHTLRKTFGYWHYQQYKDVAILQEIFNHSAPSITLRYIGINADIIDASIDNFHL